MAQLKLDLVSSYDVRGQKAKKCYLCRRPDRALLNLSAKVNESVREQLELVFECSLDGQEICYPCRNQFETALFQLVSFKNKVIFNTGACIILFYLARRREVSTWKVFRFHP